MVPLAISVIILCTAAPLLVPARRALDASLTGALIMVTLVHVEMAPATLICAVISLPIMQIIGWSRSRSKLVIPPLAPLFFLAYWTVINISHALDLYDLAYALLSGAGLIAVAVTARTLGTDAKNALIAAAVVCLPILVTLSASETLFGANAIWPRRDGITFRLTGGNNLLPWLDSRAMATSGYAITLGVVAACLSSVVIYQAAQERRWRLAALGGLGLLVVLLSGTRTAIVGLTLGMLISFMWSRKTVWLSALLCGGLAMYTVFADLGANESFAASDSVVHRLRVSQSLPSLFNLPPANVIFGSGFDYITELFDSGYISGVPGIMVLDNAYVGVFIGLGAVGFLLLILAIVQAVVSTPPAFRAMILVFVITLGSYDVTTWKTLVILLVVGLCVRAGPRTPLRSTAYPRSGTPTWGTGTRVEARRVLQ